MSTCDPTHDLTHEPKPTVVRRLEVITDVGGRRKGFHVAVIVSARQRLAVVERPRRLLTPGEAAIWISGWRPRLVGVDAPRQLGDYLPRFHGERRLDEIEIPWLSGYENSRPVRIGNGASNQFQLDVYGDVLFALYHAQRDAG